MRLWLPALALWLIVSPVSVMADTIYVPSDEPTIQAGLDAATAWDTVIVACGTYYEHDIVLKDGVFLRSQTGRPGCVTIDAQRLGRVMTIDGLLTYTRVSGFTLTGGLATGSGLERHGGGISCANTSYRLTLDSLIVTGNEAEVDGGGIYCRDSSSGPIYGCVVSDNLTGSAGGGICLVTGSNPTIYHVVITGNRATAGGGIRCDNSSPNVNNCTISGNRAWGGGGIQVADNSTVRLNGSILWGNCADNEGDEARLGSSTAYLRFQCSDTDTTLIEGPGDIVWAGGSMILDPLFVSPEPCENAPTAAGSYYLSPLSPCLDDPTCELIGALGEVPSWDTWRVPDDAPTIQAGIDSASHGDTVLVACGTYTWTSEATGDSLGLVHMKSGIILRSETGDTSCVTIDAESMGRVIYCDSIDTMTRLEGLTITGGLVGGSEYGGGMLCHTSSPIISHCAFVGNSAGEPSGGVAYGGGLACHDDSSPLVEECSFSDNSADGYGGGLSCQSPFVPTFPHIINCTFLGNHAVQAGGGVHCHYSYPTITGCTFSENTSTSSSGGGLSCSYSSLIIINCTFSNNVCHWRGGGLSSDFSAITLDSCLFSGNSSLDRDGGGISCEGGSSGMSITSCTFVGNSAYRSGGGMSCYIASPTLANCTFSGNSSGDSEGGGIYCESASPTIENSIIAFTTQGEALYCTDPSSDPAITCSDFFGNAGGDWVGWIADQYGVDGNFSANPLFCDASGGDFTLAANSPCLDTLGCGLVGVWGSGCPASTQVREIEERPATELSLGSAVPNPFNPRTEITYMIPGGGDVAHVYLSIYDTTGRLVRTLIDSPQPPGSHALIWDGTDDGGHQAASGVYFYRLTWNGESVSRRMVMVR